MKVLIGLLCMNSAFQAYAATSSKAYGYTFDPNLQSYQDPPSISPIAARLLLAQRLGLSQYHNLNNPNEDTIEILNRFGADMDQTTIFRNPRTNSERLLIFVENVEHPEDLIDSRIGNPLFEIDNPPSSTQNLQLAMDLLIQDRGRRIMEGSSCAFELSKNEQIRGGINSGSSYLKGCSPDTSISDILKEDTAASFDELVSIEPLSSDSTAILHISSLEGITLKDGDHYRKATNDLKTFFQKLYSFHANRPGTTIILMPPQSKTARHVNSSPYGTYNTHNIVRRRQSKAEQPLTAPSAAESLQNSPPSPPQALFAPALPKGILPVCQPTKESCISRTNNCSSHGTVYLKHKLSDSKKECWACKCESTTRTNADGKGNKTTQWGGPACQKKDVSVPFFLLAGFTIALLMTVSWAIGLLFSIGQEDLPSVIGAGVAGPRAQK